MKVKVCGLREPENIEDLKQLPLDFMGFVFYKSSPRDATDQKDLKKLLKDSNWNSKIARVGVVVDAEIDKVLNLVHDYCLDYIQLHGGESPEYIRELRSIWSIGSIRSAKVIKAFSIGKELDYAQIQPYEQYCELFLFDTKGKKPGGNGETFNWSLLKKYKGVRPFLLSGGIDLESASNIRQLDLPQLTGVDINSKFEIKPGLKDVEKVKQFLQKLEK